MKLIHKFMQGLAMGAFVTIMALIAIILMLSICGCAHFWEDAAQAEEEVLDHEEQQAVQHIETIIHKTVPHPWSLPVAFAGGALADFLYRFAKARRKRLAAQRKADKNLEGVLK